MATRTAKAAGVMTKTTVHTEATCPGHTPAIRIAPRMAKAMTAMTRITPRMGATAMPVAKATEIEKGAIVVRAGAASMHTTESTCTSGSIR